MDLRRELDSLRTGSSTIDQSDRLIFFEHARKCAEVSYAANPLDADNLTKWGGALLELSQFQNMEDSKKMIQESITKLEEALTLHPNNRYALWCAGNALTTQAFMNPDTDEAKVRFDQATDYFRLAVAEDPSNELFVKSLEVAAKAPQLHMVIHKSVALGEVTAAVAAAAVVAVEPSTSSRPRGKKSLKKKKKKKNSELKYDVVGCMFLAVGIATLIGFAKSNMPAPPPLQ